MDNSEVDTYLESKTNAELLYQLIYDFLEENDVTVWDLVACLEQIKHQELEKDD